MPAPPESLPLPSSEDRPADDPEARLLPRAIAGDASAVGELLVLHAEALLAHIQRKIPAATRTKFDAEDILQQTYIEAIKAISRFEPRGPGAFLGWLQTIAGNKLIDAGRKKSPVLHAPAASDDSSISNQIGKNVQDSAPGAGTRAMKAEMRGAFHVALANLPPKHREVVRLRYIEDRSLEEVAATLGVTEGAARGMCHRARRALREEIVRLSRFI